MNRFSVFIAAIAVAFLGASSLPVSADHHTGAFSRAAMVDGFGLKGQLQVGPQAPSSPDQFARTAPSQAKIVVAAGGRKVPLGTVLKDLRRRYKGKHLSAVEKRGQYRIKWKTPDGRVRLIVVDAQTGREL